MQESLSVSGILLGKTMGRTTELADRFEADSLRLADLEVRQRMAGRWVMASIQTSFAVMPAAVYWFGGSPSFTDRVDLLLVSFTTLQTRLFFPVGSLLGVGLDVQTSLALFDRIFEYLDQPVDIEEKPEAVTHGRRGRRRLRPRVVRLRRRAGRSTTSSFTVPTGTTTAIVGETGSGKTTLGYLTARLYDVGGERLDRRHRRPRPDLRGAVRPRRGRLAGDVSLPRVRSREPSLREAGRDRRRGRGSRARPRASTT